ncbi:MAG: pilus assembly protein TadG-related protein [Candidatus Limnocylindria bacterium]|nr:pilus assembly protein TadG-related protein [Candidatus Limnocylindria bacterium]
MQARRFARQDTGQSVIIVALMFAILMGAGGMALDIGRFYAERRFIQSAMDAAALACARAYVTSGRDVAQAWAAGDRILQDRNLRSDPLGLTVTYAARGSETYDGNVVESQRLSSGILPITSTPPGCRVAVTVAVPTYLIKVISPALNTISMTTRAYAVSAGGMLPIVVNRYRDPPGPSSSFLDYTKEEAYQLLSPNTCSENVPGACPDAEFSPLGCTSGCHWGPETIIVGSGYNSSDADFRGFIALDIRDFTTIDAGTGDPIHEYYNDTLGLNSNQLKDKEASYVKEGGYPGPDLIAYIPGSSPVQAELQIATMSGNSTGIVVDSFKTHYQLGDLILGQVFDGQVRTIPDFTIGQLTSLPATSPSGPANGPTFRVGANQSFRADGNTVRLTMLRDAFNGSSSDTPSQLHDFRFDPDYFVPAGGAGTTVTIKDLHVDSGLASGIYSVIISGTGYQPGGTELTTHAIYVPANIGAVARDFSLDFAANSLEVVAGINADFTASLNTSSGGTAWGSGTVTMALDTGTCSSGRILLTQSGGNACVTATVSPSSAVPSKLSPPTVTVTVLTTGLSGSYTAVLRARGTNQSGQPVVHVIPLQITVGGGAGGSRNYVNIQGYAVFMITNTAANTIYGRAVTATVADPNDLSAALGRKIRLVPWETP